MRTFAIILCIYAAGCSTTQEAYNKISSQYLGQNMDIFVIDRGVPMAKHKLSDGGYVYIWNSGVISYDMPQTVNTYGNVDSYGNVNATSQVSGGGAINVFCELQIHTDEKNIIQSIKIRRDTIGNWETSRCHEIFGR